MGDLADMTFMGEMPGYCRESAYIRRSRTCRCCKKTGLLWGRHKGKWRLFEGDELHHCPVNPLVEQEGGGDES